MTCSKTDRAKTGVEGTLSAATMGTLTAKECILCPLENWIDFAENTLQESVLAVFLLLIKVRDHLNPRQQTRDMNVQEDNFQVHNVNTES